MLPGEGADSDYPVLRLLMDVAIGAVCGFMGAVWVRTHAYTAGVLKRWRLREPDHFAPDASVSSNQQPLLAEGSASKFTVKKCLMRLLLGIAVVLVAISAIVHRPIITRYYI